MSVRVFHRGLRLTDSTEPVKRLRSLAAIEVPVNLTQDLFATGEEFIAREGKTEYSPAFRFD
jgi:hypothetical protein